MDHRKWIDKALEVARNVARRFVAAPLETTLKLLGVILLFQVILAFFSELTGVGRSAFGLDAIEWSLLLVVAWVLLSGQVSRIFIGLFLLFVFLFSIGFLIFPIDQVAAVVRTSLGVDDRTIVKFEQDLSRVDSRIWYAQYEIKELGKKSDKNAKNLKVIEDELEAARRALDESKRDILGTIRATAPGDGAIQPWVRQLAEAVERFLRIGAPFIFSMLMGALGSSIIITQQFITNYANKPPAWYLYRLIQGMTIALLMVYGLAAGILSLGGQQQPIDTQNFEQNKFFIGFISALAGLFSEHAFAKLQDVSRTLFAVAEKALKGGGDEAPPVKPTRPKPRPNKN